MNASDIDCDNQPICHKRCNYQKNLPPLQRKQWPNRVSHTCQLGSPHRPSLSWHLTPRGMQNSCLFNRDHLAAHLAAHGHGPAYPGPQDGLEGPDPVLLFALENPILSTICPQNVTKVDRLCKICNVQTMSGTEAAAHQCVPHKPGNQSALTP